MSNIISNFGIGNNFKCVFLSVFQKTNYTLQLINSKIARHKNVCDIDINKRTTIIACFF